MKLNTLHFRQCGILSCEKLILLFLSLFTLAFFSPTDMLGQQSTEQAKIELLKSQNGNNKSDPGARKTVVEGITTVPRNLISKQTLTLPVSDERCGFIQVEEMIKKKYPDRPSQEQFEKWMKQAKILVQSQSSKRASSAIPVVVHIVGGGPINISDAQVQSQIDVLTADFTRMNVDSDNTPLDFLDIAADSDIEFCLASVDPDGNPSNGINRFDGGQTSYTIGDMEALIKPTSIWHPDFYFNIWVAPLQGGLLGYAQFPSNSTLDGFDENEGPSFTDGIVVRDFAFGVGGSAEAPFNLGRTTTHEAGHFFGLRHIGGDGGCGADDFCADTPTQDGQNLNMVDDCAYDPDAALGSSRNDCDDGPGDLPDQFMNYMDYSDDACMNLFTLDQKARMDVVLDLSPRRASLLSSGVCSGNAPDYTYDPFADAPDNDLCGGAIPVDCDDVITGSTILASPLEQPAACSPEPEAPGVWYSIVGDGNPLTASLCSDTDYDSKIGIYSGSCENPVCEGGDDDGCGGIGVPSEVTIETVDGETYYVFVTGWNGSTGNFTLTITCDDEPPVGGPENDFCEDAVAIECGSTVEGTTIGALQDLTGTCVTSIDAPGVWYSFVGTGDFVLASLCDGTAYDSKIHVIESVDCNSDLFCVTGNDDGCGIFGGPSESLFLGELGVNYYIYVNGWNGSTGNFTLSVTCVPAAENDLCENAIPLDCDSSVDGSTLLASASDIVGENDCGEDPFSDLLGPGVWYTIEGTGAEITLSTCGTADYDTKIDVYTGECGALECLDGNEDGPGCPGFTSELTFSSEEGVTYSIYISGYTDAFFGSSQGDFTLNVECVCVADAGDCATVYNGYTPASCTDLTATMLYGVGPYTYEWSNGILDQSTTVCPTESTTYYVTITDAEGCTSEDEVFVDVIDVSCGNKDNKVQICHSSGNSGNSQTLCISSSAVAGHLCHGDALGSCETVVICGEPFACGSGSGQSMNSEVATERSFESAKWNISPNPSAGLIQVALGAHEGESITINIFDTSGKMIYSKAIAKLEQSNLNIDLENSARGMYYIQLKSENSISTKKLLLIK